MKKIFIILLCGVLLFGVTGCGKNKFRVGEKSTVEVVDKYVTFDLNEETLTNTSATVIFRNNREYNVNYGTLYELEIKQDGEWHKIDIEMFFNMPLLTLKSGETTELEFNWEDSHGELKAGEYRIVKSISVENDEVETFHVAAEFTISE